MDDIKKEVTEGRRAQRPRFEEVKRSKPPEKRTEDVLGAVGAEEEETLRKTGIHILGDVRWGTHFCLFYHTKQDLIDILVPYFKAGLENNEFCMWVTCEPLAAADAKKALKRKVKKLDAYIKKGQIEILDYSDWYTMGGEFEADRVLQGWAEKESYALKKGFAGLRLTGNTLWLEKKDWAKFTDYEAVVNSVIGKYRMLAVCTYSLAQCGASEILDVEQNHQFSLIKWRGDWKILESSSSNQLEARLAEQTAITRALEHSKKDWVTTFNAISDWVVLVDLKGRILRTNRAGEDFTGRGFAEIVGQSCCKLVHGSERHIPGCPLKKVTKTGQRASAELQVPGTDQWLTVTVDPVTDEKGKLIGAVHITRDITERKKAEKSLYMSHRVLEIANRCSEMTTLLTEFVTEVKAFTKCAAVGIRLLDEEGNIPYEAYEGFSEKFYESESPLSIKSDQCMCINVIKGEADSKLPFYTKGGSFYMNGTTRFLATVSEEEKGRTRNVCNEVGYESVALVPIRTRGRIAGLIHVADPQEDMVPLRMVKVLETVAMQLCPAIHRVQAQEALRVNEQRYRSLIESCHEVILRKDRDGHYHTLNLKAAISLGGRCIEDIEGKTDYDLLPKEQADALRKIDKEVMESGKDIEVEEVVRNAQGEDRIYLSRKWPIYDSQGRINGISCFAMDITERKRAEEAMRESEERYRQLVSTTTDAIMLFDAQTREFIEVNKACEALYGYSKEEFLNLKHEDITAEPDRSDESIKKALKGDVTRIPIRYHKKKDGTVFPVEISASSFEMAGRTVLCGVIRDITDRKRTEEAVRESEQKLRLLFEGTYDLVSLTDANAKTLWANPAWRKIFGSESEYRPDPFRCIHPDDLERVTKSWQNLVSGEATIRNLEYRYKMPEGEYSTFESSAYPVIIGEEKLYYVVAHDITERKRAEQEIENLAKFPSENPYPVFRIAADGTVLYANAASDTLLAESKSGLGQLCPDKWRNIVDEVLKTGLIERMEASHKERTFAFRIVPVQDANYVNFYGIDITERKKAEDRLLDHQEQLKSLASELTLAEERERRRIAIDLHDHVSQSLSSSKMKLQQLLGAEPPARAAGTLDEVCNLLGESIGQMRLLTFDLSSPVLYELGFETAVADWLEEQIGKRYNLKVEFADDEQAKPLDDDIRVLLFRNVRELLINVVKHAHAQSVKVSVGKAGSEIEVRVEDDGWGFEPEKAAARGTEEGGFGLFSIRERLEQLGGLLEIKSVPGQGCKVTMRAPLRKTGVTNEG